MYEKNYEFLSEAIVIQAAKDYRRANSQLVRNEVKRFFLSDWFYDLTVANGRMLFERLEQERRKKPKRQKGGSQSIDPKQSRREEQRQRLP